MPDAVATPARARGRPRSELAIAVLALAAGIVIAIIDSGPTWDDTGITVAMLFGAAAVTAAAAGSRPWLWAFLVGAPLPIIEIAAGGSTASLIALTFAAVGAGIGWVVRRAVTAGTGSGPDAGAGGGAAERRSRSG